MRQRKTLNELCDELYDDPEVAAFVRESVAEAGTEQKIMDGERVMLHPIDAERNYLKSKGLYGRTATETAQAVEINALKDRLSALEQGKPPPNTAIMEVS